MPGCLLLGILAALLLYYKSDFVKDKPLQVKVLLYGLRVLSVSLLAFLLLSPFIRRTETEIKKPILVFLQDESQSMSLSIDKEAVNAWAKDWQAVMDDLSEDFEVKNLSFGSQIEAGGLFTFEDKETDIEQALKHSREVFDPQRLGAVIVISDGLYNRGGDPLYSGTLPQAPIYTIATGNPTPVRDVSIRRIFHNKVTYKGDQFTVQLDVSAKNAPNTTTELSIFDITSGQSKLVDKKLIQLEGDPFFKTIEILFEAKEAGLRRYRFTLSSISDEKNLTNNTREMFIEVLDARQKILLLAESPHPDISAIRQSLQGSRNYDIKVTFTKDPLPNLKAFDLVILHQIPSQNAQKTGLTEAIKNARVPLWFIVGTQTDLNTLNSLQSLLTIIGDGRSFNEIQAVVSPDFKVFTTSDILKNQLRTFPPMIAPFGEFKPSLQASVLLYQRIGSITTEFPLWIMGQDGPNRIGLTAGEGIWKWRLFDYLQHKNHDITDELLRKTVQYLALKEDKRRFRVQSSQPLYKENEPIRFDAEFYNANYELINEPDIEVILEDENNKEFRFNLNKTNKMYTLNAGLFPPGDYNFIAKTNFDGQEFTQSGKFVIQEINLELLETQADHNFLKLLANETGGTMMLPADITKLPEIIRENQNIKPTQYAHITNKPLIDWRWFFAIVLGLLGLEWFIRRYLGAY